MIGSRAFHSGDMKRVQKKKKKQQIETSSSSKWSDLLGELLRQILRRLNLSVSSYWRNWSDLPGELLRSCSNCWSELPLELLGEIFRRLNFIDVARAKSVCSHWSSVVSPLLPANSRTPWLLIPPKHHTFPRIGKGITHLYNPADGHLHRTKTLAYELETSFLIGSSHGCLIGVTSAKYPIVPFVLNPLTGTRISLPSVGNLIDLSFARQGKSFELTNYLRRHIKKAILNAELSHQVGSNCAAVILLYGNPYGNKLASCSLSGNDSWTELDVKREWYYDVCLVDGKVFLLANSFTVEIWDCSKPPPFLKLTTLEAEPLQLSRMALFTMDFWCPRFYLAMPLLVVRKVACTVASMDPVGTVGFEVYKMDERKENWVKAESLGENRALFLGKGSDSVSVTVTATGGIVADCIYYTEDCWYQDWSYRGRGDEHCGWVFNLREGEIRQLDGTNLLRDEESARWIFPAPS